MKLVFIYLWMLVLFGIWSGCENSIAAEQKKNLLLISSYHPNFPTFFQQIDGIRSVLPSQKYNLDVEYIDSKRFPDKLNLERFHRYLRDKLGRLPEYDAVFVSDDNAFNFIVEYQEELFPEIPIVFLGVNNIQNALEQNNNKFMTGVVEATSIRDTVLLAKSLMPKLNSVVAISDSTTSGSSDLQLFKKLSGDFPNLDFSCLCLDKVSWSELQGSIRELDKNSCILLLSAYSDVNGEGKLFSESLDLIVSAATVPIFHLWEHGMGDGLTGGKVISHFQQGRKAAEIAKKILKGQVETGEIKVSTYSPNQYMLDYDMLSRFGFDKMKLPEGTIILNNPVSFYQKHRMVILSFSGVIIIMAVIICFLVINIRKRKIVEKALRLSKQIFETLFNKSVQFAGLLTAEGKILNVNESALRMAGLDFDAIRGEYFWESKFWAGTGYEQDIRLGLEKAATGKLVRFIVENRSHDNKVLTVDFSAKPVFDNDNNVIEILVEGRDITKLKLYEERVSRIENIESIGLLAAGIAHDFNNMLTGIVFSAEVLKSHVESDSTAAALGDNIILYSKNAPELIGNLLDFARKKDASVDILELHSVVKDAINLLHGTIKNDIEISTDFQAESSCIIGDKAQIMNVLINLGINASHAMPEGGQIQFITRVVSIDKSSCMPYSFNLKSGAYIELSVGDTGSGIESENMDKIFDPFFTTKEDGHGTGLGLAAAFNTMKQHNGGIDVSSVVGEGTEFRLLFPLTMKPQNGKNSKK